MSGRFLAPLAVLAFAGSALGAQLTIRNSNGTFQNQVSITVEGEYRYIRSNGIPNHATGRFPGPGNPNTISAQHYEFRVPVHPKAAEKTTRLVLGPFGVAVNGVAFDPGANEWWNGDPSSGWQKEPLMMVPLYLGVDSSHGHVQPTGAYHYHGIPTGLVAALTDGKAKMVIVGWAADGFPIYNNVGFTDPKSPKSAPKALRSSYRVKAGQRTSGPGGKYDGLYVNDYEYVSGAGDLDECNGVFSATPEYPEGIYHYVLTEEFPYIPRMWRGTPDSTFRRGPGGPGGPGGRGGRGGRGGQGGPGDGRYHLIPPFGMEQLNLNDEQQKQVQALERETFQKLQTILTGDQVQALKSARPQRGEARGAGGDNPPPSGMHVIPPFAEGTLNLTEGQKSQIAELAKNAEAKLAKVLTAEQMKTLAEARPPQGGPPGG
jgi:hypothetical protein